MLMLMLLMVDDVVFRIVVAEWETMKCRSIKMFPSGHYTAWERRSMVVL
jgi:hypothetical protein